MDSTAAMAMPGASTPGSVLRHTLGALTLGSPHQDDGSCFALPDVLDAPAFTCGASQEVGVFWCVQRVALGRSRRAGRLCGRTTSRKADPPTRVASASTPDFITPQEAQFGIVGGVGHGAEKVRPRRRSAAWPLQHL